MTVLGCPIPVINCDDCGVVKVPESQLPVTLPEDIEFEKTGNPLVNHPNWKNVSCPNCEKPATRKPILLILLNPLGISRAFVVRF